LLCITPKAAERVSASGHAVALTPISFELIAVNLLANACLTKKEPVPLLNNKSRLCCINNQYAKTRPLTALI